MPPKPCEYCGINFMPPNKNSKHCNSCTKPLGKKMSDITIIIEIDHKIAAEIEEICVNEGCTFSEYFLKLHKQNISADWITLGINESQKDETKKEKIYHMPSKKGKK